MLDDMETQAYKIQAACRAGLSLFGEKGGEPEYMGGMKEWNRFAELCELQEKLNEGYALFI